MNAITLFRNGKDTLEISEITGNSEAEVYNEIGRYRARNNSARRLYKKINQFQNDERRECQSRLIKYAGHPGS